MNCVPRQRLESIAFVASPPPKIALQPDGAGWSIVPADAAAHVVVDIKSIFDGTVTHVDEDVPFRVGGTITMLPDGTASIQVQSAG